MKRIFSFTAMILLSGAGAALSSLFWRTPGMWRGFILGAALALAIVIGDGFIRNNLLKSNFAQILLGTFIGLLSGMAILFWELRIPPSGLGRALNSPLVIVLLGGAYGGAFQWVIMSHARRKMHKLFNIAFACIAVKLYFTPGTDLTNVIGFIILVGVNAWLFTVLWYFPVWCFYTKKYSWGYYFRCIILNIRILKLVFAKRWLSIEDYATSYDKIATTYDEHWLRQLRPVTEKLLIDLPEIGIGDILDLGCGTGLSTAYLEKEYPGNPVFGVDISAEMLNVAEEKCSRSKLIEADIPDFLKSRHEGSAALVFSSWAIGYSSPSKIISEAARVLEPGGVFAFVVNYSDTLKPVFQAFSKCMNRFSGEINMALWPKFPRKAGNLLRPLHRNGFTTQMQEDGDIPIFPPGGEISLEWLLKTGILAGFDQVMPLHDNPKINEFFNKALRESEDALLHHYFMGIFIKNR